MVAAAREAGLQFIVVADHNVLPPGAQGYHGGILVVAATEVSTAFGHVVALGVPRALTAEERETDPLQAIALLGGEPVLAHPLHPRRPFTGWGRGAWRGLEILSNDTSWGDIAAGSGWGRALAAALMLPWDAPRAVLAASDGFAAERRRFDAELRAVRGQGTRNPARVLLCSADAHGYPSYAAAFGAFSMHLPLTLSGDGDTDARGVVAALADGRGACVLDAVAPAGVARLAPARGGTALELTLDAPDLTKARFTLLRDGEPVAARAAAARAGAAVVPFDCGGGRCPAGDYRVEATWAGASWIFTNPVTLE